MLNKALIVTGYSLLESDDSLILNAPNSRDLKLDIIPFQRITINE